MVWKRGSSLVNVSAENTKKYIDLDINPTLSLTSLLNHSTMYELSENPLLPYGTEILIHVGPQACSEHSFNAHYILHT